MKVLTANNFNRSHCITSGMKNGKEVFVTRKRRTEKSAIISIWLRVIIFHQTHTSTGGPKVLIERGHKKSGTVIKINTFISGVPQVTLCPAVITDQSIHAEKVSRRREGGRAAVFWSRRAKGGEGGHRASWAGYTGQSLYLTLHYWCCFFLLGLDCLDFEVTFKWVNKKIDLSNLIFSFFCSIKKFFNNISLFHNLTYVFDVFV